MQSLRIVAPVFNDWTSLQILLRKLDSVASELPVPISVSVINDGSTEPAHNSLDGLDRLACLSEIEVVDLAVNVGHQRAIAIGLCLAVESTSDSAILIMDSDGEDPPEQLGRLLECARGREDYCIVAQRRKRNESLLFKVSYRAYRALFILLTGNRISFGNFSLISKSYARRLTLTSDLWNNLAAAVLRSRLPIDRMAIDRGRRYAGKSKMNYVSLVVHGISGISVYADVIFVRLLFLAMALTVLTTLTIVGTFLLRVYYPAHATPGWATTLSMGMIVLLVQTIFTALSSILMLLNSRVQRLIVPLQEYRPYIYKVTSLVRNTLTSPLDVTHSEESHPRVPSGH